MRQKHNRSTSKEENVAVRLSGKVKNFTGRGPAVIKVKINDNVATVQFKWILNSIEKSFLHNCTNQELVTTMQSKLHDNAKGYLLRAFSEVFNSEARILEVKEESLQEKLSIQAQVGIAS